VVELFIDAHDGDAGFRLAILDRALNRRRPAVLRKNRSVNVEESALRNLQERGRKNLSIRHDDADIGLGRRDHVDRVADFCRLRQRQSELVCFDRHRRRLQFQAASGALVGLGDDERDFVLARERLERGNRKFGSAEKNDTQSSQNSTGCRLSVVGCRQLITDN